MAVSVCCDATPKASSHERLAQACPFAAPILLAGCGGARLRSRNPIGGVLIYEVSKQNQSLRSGVGSRVDFPVPACRCDEPERIDERFGKRGSGEQQSLRKRR